MTVSEKSILGWPSKKFNTKPRKSRGIQRSQPYTGFMGPQAQDGDLAFCKNAEATV